MTPEQQQEQQNWLTATSGSHKSLATVNLRERRGTDSIQRNQRGSILKRGTMSEPKSTTKHPFTAGAIALSAVALGDYHKQQLTALKMSKPELINALRSLRLYSIRLKFFYNDSLYYSSLW